MRECPIYESHHRTTIMDAQTFPNERVLPASLLWNGKPLPALPNSLEPRSHSPENYFPWPWPMDGLTCAFPRTLARAAQLRSAALIDRNHNVRENVGRLVMVDAKYMYIASLAASQSSAYERAAATAVLSCSSRLRMAACASTLDGVMRTAF